MVSSPLNILQNAKMINVIVDDILKNGSWGGNLPLKLQELEIAASEWGTIQKTLDLPTIPLFQKIRI